MRKLGIVLFLTLAGTVAAGSTGARGALAAPAAKACVAIGYSHSVAKCTTIPGKGAFKVTIPGKHAALTGKGTQGTAGTQLTVVVVPPPALSRGGFGLLVRATGKFAPLHLSKGKLFRFAPSSGTLTAVSAVTKPGLYQVLP